jgi:hypothetical protein
MDKKEEFKFEQTVNFPSKDIVDILSKGELKHTVNFLSKGSIAYKVDFLFTLPVINPDESHGELMPSIYVDEKGNKHQFKKISHNSPQAIDCVEYGYNAWREKNGNNNIDQWRDNIIEMLNIYTEQTRDKTLKLKIGAYINLVDLFVMQEKERVKNNKSEDVDFLDGHKLNNWTDKIAFLNELGVIDFLMERYPKIKKPSKLSRLIQLMIAGNIGTIKTNISALISEDGVTNKNYPIASPKVKNIISTLNEDSF